MGFFQLVLRPGNLLFQDDTDATVGEKTDEAKHTLPKYGSYDYNHNGQAKSWLPVPETKIYGTSPIKWAWKTWFPLEMAWYLEYATDFLQLPMSTSGHFDEWTKFEGEGFFLVPFKLWEIFWGVHVNVGLFWASPAMLDWKVVFNGFCLTS